MDLGRVISWTSTVQRNVLPNFFTNFRSILDKWGEDKFNEYFGENDLIVLSILIS